MIFKCFYTTVLDIENVDLAHTFLSLNAISIYIIHFVLL